MVLINVEYLYKGLHASPRSAYDVPSDVGLEEMLDTRSLVSEISLALGYLDESFIHQRFDAAHPEYVKGSLTNNLRVSLSCVCW